MVEAVFCLQPVRSCHNAKIIVSRKSMPKIKFYFRGLTPFTSPFTSLFSACLYQDSGSIKKEVQGYL
jgi:hypothetical protein